MKQLKKTLLTLALLITAVTGAWAETGENIFQYCYDCQRSPAYPKTTASASLSGFANPYVGYNGSGFSVENTSAGPWKLEYMGLWSTTDKHEIDDVSDYQYTYNCTDVPVFRLYQWNATANEYQHAAYGVVCAYAKVTNAVEHTAMFVSKDGLGCVLTNSSHSSSMNITFDEDLTTGLTTLIAAATPAASGTAVEVAWNKAENSGSFTMPGGNVTLEPEYYPQAELTAKPTAINDVPATTDGAIVNAGTVATIGETTTAQGTVMYYVSPSALDDAALLALAATDWTADVPTAESLTEGQAYVYYYVRGNDGDTDDKIFSDGDILSANALTVTIAAEPTYAVTFADDTAEPDKWTADPNAGVKKGETVTVTYSGTKKVIGVKAEKKAAAVPKDAKDATAEDVGKVMCDKGHLHDAKTPVPDGCTAVGILGKVTETGHGLILALQDATQQRWNTINGWTSVDTYAGTTLKLLPDDTARGSLTSYTTLGSTTVSNWAVAQKSDYDAIFTNLGSATGDSDGMTYDGNVNAYITEGVGGTAISGNNWSATLDSGNWAYDFESEFWNITGMSNSLKVRPVLGF